METSKVLKRGIGIALSLLFINSALADSTTDARIQAYKANKLIPQHVVLPTSTGAADSDKVVMFDSGKLTWQSNTAAGVALVPLVSKYAGMTLQEIKDAMEPSGTWDDNMWDWAETGWISGVTSEQQELREYLSAVANGKITSDSISSADALSYLEMQFETIAGHSLVYGIDMNFDNFPCEGLDFTGLYFVGVDLSSCTGITGEQIMSAMYIGEVKLPAITFTGNEDFTGKDLNYTDLSKCTGITAEQITNASRIDSIRISSAQYNDWKSVLSSKFSGEKICVDGEYIIIP